MEHKFSVILAEDELVIRNDFIQKIHAINDNFQVIASAANGRDALSLVQELKPDLLITDIQMPIIDGIELIKQIRTQFPEMNIIIISGFDNFQYAQTALKYNVMDYLLKPVDSSTFSCLLSDLESKLKLQNESEQREILLRDLRGLPVQNRAIEQFLDSRFGLYFINVGNLHLKTGVSLQQEEYYTIIESDHFIEACNKVLSRCEQIFVMDERLPNQKCILVIQPDTTYDSSDRAIKLHQTLNTICSPVPVSICTIPDTVSFKELRSTAGNLRKQMETKLILCRGELFIYDY
ncbi:MAG: response regulator, partial [Bacillota bacterium]